MCKLCKAFSWYFFSSCKYLKILVTYELPFINSLRHGSLLSFFIANNIHLLHPDFDSFQNLISSELFSMMEFLLQSFLFFEKLGKYKFHKLTLGFCIFQPYALFNSFFFIIHVFPSTKLRLYMTEKERDRRKRSSVLWFTLQMSSIADKISRRC